MCEQTSSASAEPSQSTGSGRWKIGILSVLGVSSFLPPKITHCQLCANVRCSKLVYARLSVFGGRILGASIKGRSTNCDSWNFKAPWPWLVRTLHFTPGDLTTAASKIYPTRSLVLLFGGHFRFR